MPCSAEYHYIEDFKQHIKSCSTNQDPTALRKHWDSRREFFKTWNTYKRGWKLMLDSTLKEALPVEGERGTKSLLKRIRQEQQAQGTRS